MVTGQGLLLYVRCNRSIGPYWAIAEYLESDEIRALLSRMEQTGHDCGRAIRTTMARARNLRRSRFRFWFHRRTSLQSQRKLDAVAGDLLHRRGWAHA